MLPRSSFRKLLVDWYAWHVDLAWLEETSSIESLAQHPAFTAEITSRLAMRLRSNRQSPLLGNPESYFELSAIPYYVEAQAKDDDSVVSG